MKNIATLIILFILSSQICMGQTEFEDVSLFIKSWGISRYRVGSDVIDFQKVDSIGYVGISKLLKKNNKRRTNRLIKEVISIHEHNNLQPANQAKESKFNLDITWIDNNRINKSNSENLHILSAQKPDSPPYPIKAHPAEGTWSLEYFIPDSKENITKYVFGIGLLWNHVEFFFQKKNEISIKWGTYLEEILSDFLKNPSLKNYELTISEMLSHLQDGHAKVNSFSIMKANGFFRLPIEIRSDSSLARPIVVKTFKNNQQTNPLSTEDRIISINGLSFEDFYKKNQLYLSGNQMVKVEKACSKYILTDSKKKLEIKVLRDSAEYIFDIPPIHITETDQILKSNICDSTPVSYYGDSIAYINLSLIDPLEFSEYYDKIKSFDCIIMDLRYYPKNILDTLSNYFFSNKKIISEYIQPDFLQPGYIEASKFDKLGVENTKAYSGLIVPLVNHNTFSQGEYITLALSSLKNSYIVGSPTSGTDGNIIKFDLPFNLRGRFSAIMINYPDSSPTFKSGLKIDFQINPEVIFVPGYDPELSLCIETIQMHWDQWLFKPNLIHK